MDDDLKETDLREALVESYRYLDAHRLTELSSGNVSCRVKHSVLISANGATAQNIRVETIVKVGLNGTPQGEGRVSSELPMHLSIYSALPDVRAIVHTHSDCCIALAGCERGIPGFHYLVGGFGGDDIPCTPYATFGSQELAKLAADALKHRKGCLLANHGAICHGTDIKDATMRAHRLEILARQYLLSLGAGEPRLLTEQDWRGYRMAVKGLQYG